jgi:hypothetical protein
VFCEVKRILFDFAKVIKNYKVQSLKAATLALDKPTVIESASQGVICWEV